MPVGQKAWSILTEPHNLTAMKTAIQLKRPPAEAMDEVMYSAFGRRLDNQAIQMIGEMIAQLMEACGAHRTGRKARLPDGKFFHSGMKYSYPIKQ